MPNVICTTCGSEVPEGEETCPRCGAAAVVQPRAAPVPAGHSTSGGSASSQALAAGLRSAGGALPEDVTVVSTVLPDRLTAPEGAPISGGEPVAAVEELSLYAREQMETLLRQAHIHLRRRNVPAAREACAQAQALSPSDAHVHEMFGLILEAEGDELGAYKEYQAACATKPAPPEAETRLATLLLRLPPETLALLQPGRGKDKDVLPPAAEAALPPEVRSTLAAAAFTTAAPPRHRPGAGILSFASFMLPGMGQLFRGKYIKAAVMFLVWLLCVTYIVAFVHNSRGGPLLQDPSFWGPLVVLGIDYVVSIADAAVG